MMVDGWMDGDRMDGHSDGMISSHLETAHCAR